MPRKARPSRRSGSSSSGPSLAELENNFVIACGIGSQARILAAVEFVALGTLLSSDQSELRRYEAKNLPEVCIAETFSPFLVLAKYLAIRGLTKVLIFKTQENMVTMMAECDDSVDIENKIENANNNLRVILRLMILLVILIDMVYLHMGVNAEVKLNVTFLFYYVKYY